MFTPWIFYKSQCPVSLIIFGSERVIGVFRYCEQNAKNLTMIIYAPEIMCALDIYQYYDISYILPLNLYTTRTRAIFQFVHEDCCCISESIIIYSVGALRKSVTGYDGLLATGFRIY